MIKIDTFVDKMSFAVAYEYFTNKSVILHTSWIFSKEIEEESTVLSFYSKNVNDKCDVSIDNYCEKKKSQFSIDSRGIFKFVIYKISGKCNFMILINDSSN